MTSWFRQCEANRAHAQHSWKYDPRDDETWLCGGVSRAEEPPEVHCGEPGHHPQHRNEDGSWCVGIMTALQKARHEGTPVVRLTTDDIVRILAGTSLDCDGGVCVTLFTADELLEEHKRLRQQDGLPPVMTRQQAEKLTRRVSL